MENLAEIAGLQYVNDDEPGYTRKPWGRGFTYLDAQGAHVTADKERQRLEALVIPPAWTEVWISTLPDGHIQATGRDEKGRKQYIYHADWEEARNQVKFNQLAAFGTALPHLREKVAEDLRKHTLSRDAVLALVVRLLDETLLRIGNSEYATANGSYGLTTLHNEHTDVEGTLVNFSFPGKSGKQQEAAIRDRRLAQLVKRCQHLPGQRLFQFRGEDDEIYSISSTDVNEYLRKHTDKEFTAKIFRTWGATISGAEFLAPLGPPETEKEADKNVVTAVKHAAQTLGNTPAVCRQYYLHPAIIKFYETGELAATWQKTQSGKLPIKEGLNDIETAVLHLLSTSL